jgi:peroxiredoxin
MRTSPPTAKRFSAIFPIVYTFLSDAKSDAIRAYDLAGDGGHARPTAFLIDRSGIVRWRLVTDNMYKRLRPRDVLEAAKSVQ